MKKLLDVFYPLLQKLNGENLVLTGSGVLAAHGLVLRREVVDLDVVIYNPTPEQKKYLMDLEPLSVFRFIKNEGYEGRENINLIKFKKDGLIIDIFTTLENAPEDNLCYLYNHYICGLPTSTLFRVSGVKSICDAKQSYHKKHYNSQICRDEKYNRQKDVIDLQNLKNDNFNIMP